jgi:hypothetical protein
MMCFYEISQRYLKTIRQVLGFGKNLKFIAVFLGYGK